MNARPQTIRELRRQLTPRLPAEFFRPNPGRARYLVLAYAAGLLHLAMTFGLFAGRVPVLLFFATLLCAVNSGTFFFFFMHEVLHGGVFKSRRANYVSALLAGLPFLCSPHVWAVWHNWHHKYTAMPQDTDRRRHPEYDDWNSWQTRFHRFWKTFHFSYLVSYVAPLVVIAGHHVLILYESLSGLSPLRIRKWQACGEFLLVIAAAAFPVIVLPWPIAVLGVYLPLIGSHLICNLYILTNHNDNELTRENYPLVNSTSVYLAGWFPVSHMGFGRHVEHHIYPHVTHDKLSVVTDLLRTEYADEFREKSLWQTLGAIYGSSRTPQSIVLREAEASDA